MKRIMVSVLAAAFVVFIWWAFGFDFDRRGEVAGTMVVVSAMAAVYAWVFYDFK